MTEHTRTVERGIKPPRFINLSLWVGLALVLAALFIAVRGPALAPHDPLQIHYIVHNEETGRWVRPPLDPGEAPGFPLGTDLQGRDVLSQLLHAVRPTLGLVLSVAAVRLVTGIGAGLLAVMGGRRTSRAFEAAIFACLSAPVLFVALFVIAAVGIRFGVWAFITGLALTGWAEPARIVREQVRIVRSQLYIEAALSLGASRSEVLVRHIVPQIMPLVWILLPFEVSATLMTTASLGFLGYYAHTTWMPLGDYTALRISGRPELGQMLASGARMGIDHPWSLLVAGAAVLFIVLGFNLLGAGLQARLDARRIHRRKSRLEQALEDAIVRLEDRWLEPFSPLRRNVQQGLAACLLLGVIFTGGKAAYDAQSFFRARTSVTVPGGHYWAAAGHNAQGTLWTDLPGPRQPRLLWSFENPDGFSGDPLVDADENVYLVSRAGGVTSLTSQGEVRWEAALPGEEAGVRDGPNPHIALAPDGTLVVLGAAGGLYAFDPQGSLLWSAYPDPGVRPVTPPVIDSTGAIYYASELSLVAVYPDGATRWVRKPPSYSYIQPSIHLSADEQYLLFEDTLSRTSDGKTVFPSTFDLMDRVVVGNDGKLYRNGAEAMLRIDPSGEKPQEVTYIIMEADVLGASFRIPANSGVAPNGLVWFWYEARGQHARLLWLDRAGSIYAVIDYPWETVSLIGLDRSGYSYACGVGSERVYNTLGNHWTLNKQIECWAHRPGRRTPLWELSLDEVAMPAGGALAPGRMYLTTETGILFALGD